MLKVCKFGGTSLKDANSFLIVKNIVKGDMFRKIVVVSAPGKRFKGDYKVTDLLLSYYNDQQNLRVKRQIKQRFIDIVNGLNIDIDLKKEFEKIFDVKGKSKDYVVSRGEYLTAKIMAKILNFKFIDAENILHFKGDKINVKKGINLAKKIDYNCGIVVPGFYGKKSKNIKLFCRGGSDLTGSYLSRFFKAEIYENFTDICGISMINPNLKLPLKFIKNLSFNDFKNLKGLNPSVLQKSAYKPIKRTNCSIFIKNTFNINGNFTRIKRKLKIKKPTIFSISYNNNLLIVTGRKLTKKDGLLKRVKAILKDKNIKFKVVKKRANILMFLVKNYSELYMVKLMYFKLVLNR